jgi:hypothetical protein
MKIVERLSNVEITKYPISLQVTNGGFFNIQKSGMRWKQYINNWKNIMDIERLETIRTYIVVNKIKSFNRGFNDVNFLFDDDTVAIFSFRSWGDIVAATWSQEDDKDYNYLLFAYGGG